jgi:hypothetical protein
MGGILFERQAQHRALWPFCIKDELHERPNDNVEPRCRTFGRNLRKHRLHVDLRVSRHEQRLLVRKITVGSGARDRCRSGNTLDGGHLTLSHQLTSGSHQRIASAFLLVRSACLLIDDRHRFSVLHFFALYIRAITALDTAFIIQYSHYGTEVPLRDNSTTK